MARLVFGYLGGWPRLGSLFLLLALWSGKSGQKLALADALQVQVAVVVLAAIRAYIETSALEPTTMSRLMMQA